MPGSSKSDYRVLETIGEGSFGKCQKIKRICDGKVPPFSINQNEQTIYRGIFVLQVLVWKEIQYGEMSEEEKEQLVREVNLLREFRHPNIVRYYNR